MILKGDKIFVLIYDYEDVRNSRFITYRVLRQHWVLWIKCSEVAIKMYPLFFMALYCVNFIYFSEDSCFWDSILRSYPLAARNDGHDWYWSMLACVLFIRKAVNPLLYQSSSLVCPSCNIFLNKFVIIDWTVLLRAYK